MQLTPTQNSKVCNKNSGVYFRQDVQTTIIRKTHINTLNHRESELLSKRSRKDGILLKNQLKKTSFE